MTGKSEVVNSGSFKELDAVLWELTQNHIPEYFDEVQQMDSEKLQSAMTDLIDTGMNQTVGDKSAVKTISSLAAVLSRRFQVAHKLISQASEQLTKKSQKMEQLREETAWYKRHLAEVQEELKTATSDLADTSTQLYDVIKEKERNESLMAKLATETRAIQALNETHVEAGAAAQQKEESDPARVRQELTGTSTYPPPRGLPPSLNVRSQEHLKLDGPTDKDLDRMARNITRFEPSPGVPCHVESYLKDIQFCLRKYPYATVDDKIYLIKMTSSQEVRKDYECLSPVITKEFSAFVSQTGLSLALNVKQAKNENDQDMEEDPHFKTLFLQNLHPTTSHYLGVFANPRTALIQSLREWTCWAFQKYQQTKTKQTETSVLTLSSNDPPLHLEGAYSLNAQGTYAPPPLASSHNQTWAEPMAEPYHPPQSRGQPWHLEAKDEPNHYLPGKRHQEQFNRGKWSPPQSRRYNQGPRRESDYPFQNRRPYQEQSYQSGRRSPTNHRSSSPRENPKNRDMDNKTDENMNIKSGDLEIIQRILDTIKRKDEKKVDVLSVSTHAPDPILQEAPAPHRKDAASTAVTPPTLMVEEMTPPMQLVEERTSSPKEVNAISLSPPPITHPSEEDTYSATLALQLESDHRASEKVKKMSHVEPPVPKMFCNLTEKGGPRNSVNLTLENALMHEALLDTA
uniref:Uncharacterized protein n=1 Tax=Nothobranchius furzeri TaxID=105023 RepID=A0A8C6KNI4_NOTFU